MRVDLLQGSPEWEEWRRGGIGSSDAPIIAGESPYRSALELWAEKARGIVPEVDADRERLFLMGKLLEGPLLDYYTLVSGLRVEGGRPSVVEIERGPLFQHPQFPVLRASLDGLVLTDDPVIVEAKWSNSNAWRIPDEVPDSVRVQVQHQLAVTGFNRADVVGLIRGLPRIVRVERDEELIRDLVSLELRFWQYVESGEEPREFIDGTPGTERTIRRLFPEVRQPLAPADPESVRIAHWLIEAKAELKDLGLRVDSEENALRMLIGEREGVEGPGFRATYRKNRDSVRVGWEQVALALDNIVRQFGRAEDADTIRGLYTMTVPGPRVLRVQETKGDEG